MALVERSLEALHDRFVAARAGPAERHRRGRGHRSRLPRLLGRDAALLRRLRALPGAPDGRTRRRRAPCNEAACEVAGHRVHEVIVESLNRGVADGSIRADLGDPYVTALSLWAFTHGHDPDRLDQGRPDRARGQRRCRRSSSTASTWRCGRCSHEARVPGSWRSLLVGAGRPAAGDRPRSSPPRAAAAAQPLVSDGRRPAAGASTKRCWPTSNCARRGASGAAAPRGPRPGACALPAGDRLRGALHVADGGRTIDFPVGDLLNPVYETLDEMLVAQGQPPQFPRVRNESIALLRDQEQETKLVLEQPLYEPRIGPAVDARGPTRRAPKRTWPRCARRSSAT